MILNFIVSINTNITKYLYKYPIFSSQRRKKKFSIFTLTLKLLEKKKKMLTAYFRYQQNSTNNDSQKTNEKVFSSLKTSLKMKDLKKKTQVFLLAQRIPLPN